MLKIKPHILFFVFWLIVLCISYVLNIGFMGKFFGTLVGAITDPIVLFLGILCGLLFSNYRNFLFAFLLSAVAVNLIVEFSLFDWHSEIGYNRTSANLLFVVFVRSTALLILAVLSNLIRVYFFDGVRKLVIANRLIDIFVNKKVIFILLFFVTIICIPLFFYTVPLNSKRMNCEGEKVSFDKALYQSYFSLPSHVNCPPKISYGFETPDVDCLRSQNRSEEFISKSDFSGSVVFTEYLKIFGASLWLIDANEKNSFLTDFPRNECKFETETNVVCNSQFDGGTAKIKFDITAFKLDAFVSYGNDKKIYYDLVCNKPSKN